MQTIEDHFQPLHRQLYIYPFEWRKVVPIHKAASHNEIFGFFIDQGLSSTNQSGFKSEDTCVNKLLSIMHDIYKLFDDGYEVRGVFFDISKAFDKVWCDGLIFKLQENRILGNLLRFLKHFLTSTKGLY